MATTSLWHIKGRLKDLIDYVENPEKTKAKAPELQDLYNVFSYVQRPEATQEGEYVTAINCLKETALRQMILTKKRYGHPHCPPHQTAKQDTPCCTCRKGNAAARKGGHNGTAHHTEKAAKAE